MATNRKPPVKERGIIMTGDSVPAILAGRKTMTRRLMNPQPLTDGKAWAWYGKPPCAWGLDESPPDDILRGCPHGEVGDRLYAKEAWGIFDCGTFGDAYAIAYRADGDDGAAHWPTVPPGYCGRYCMGEDGTCSADEKWRSPLFMPRWASRELLEITRVRVEHVQDISEADAIAEGIGTDIIPACGDHPALECYVTVPDDNHAYVTAREAFRPLWDSLHAAPKPRYRTIDGRKVIDHYESYPWAGDPETRQHRGKPHHIYPNPHVWAIGLKRIPND